MRSLLLSLALLLLPVVVQAQGLQASPNQAATFTSSAPSGSNALACRNTGCRIDLGPGSTDYLTSDGTNLVTPGVVVVGSNSYYGGSSFRVTSSVAISTCNSAIEGTVLRLAGTGGTNSGSQTRFCACVSDGAASPTYSWRNLISGVAGNTTTCNP